MTHPRRATPTLLISLLLAAAFAACDAVAPGSTADEVLYHTDETTETVGAVESSDGDLLVYGWTGHVSDVRPSHRTYPLMLRMDPTGSIRDTLVLDSGSLGVFSDAADVDGDVYAVMPTWDVEPDSPRATHLVRIGPDGNRTILCTFGGTNGMHVLPSAAGGVHVFRTGQGRLSKIDASCTPAWTFEASVRLVVEMTSGGFGIAVEPTGDSLSVGRLAASGEPLWIATLPGGRDQRAVKLVAAGEGLVLLTSDRERPGHVDLHRFSSDGALVWTRTFEGRSLLGHGLARLPGGGYLLAVETYTHELSPPVTQLVRLDDDGRMLWHRPYAGGHRTSIVSEILPLSSGRVAVVGHILPGIYGLFVAPLDPMVEFLDGV